jgi:hypothetical protein
MTVRTTSAAEDKKENNVNDKSEKVNDDNAKRENEDEAKEGNDDQGKEEDDMAIGLQEHVNLEKIVVICSSVCVAETVTFEIWERSLSFGCNLQNNKVCSPTFFPRCQNKCRLPGCWFVCNPRRVKRVRYGRTEGAFKLEPWLETSLLHDGFLRGRI